MKKFILIFSAFILNLFIVNFADAENFYINSYNIKMDVNEDRTVNIQEDIKVYFTRSSHGIYRTIPLKNYIIRNDGSRDVEYARITDVHSDVKFTKSIMDNNVKIKMGSPVFLVNGHQRYPLSYKYDMGNDKIKGADEFYFNIIGYQWDTTISRVYFTIKLPKKFDSRKVGFSIGDFGTSGYNPDNLKFKIIDNTIIGYTTKPLDSNEALTIRIELPDNYFVKNMRINNYVIIIAIILTLISIAIWAMFGKDEPVTPVVNFSVPEGKNSAEVEVEYSGTSTDKGITSLIFYLASKGYIEIEDDGLAFTINKIKDYDGQNKYEKFLMEILFADGKDSVSQIDLATSETFQSYCNKLKNNLNKISNSLFDKTACSIEKMSIVTVSILGLLALVLYTLGDYSFILLHNEVSFILLFPFIAVCVFILMLVSKDYSAMPFTILWCLGFGGIPIFILIPYIPNLGDNWPVLLFETACIIISIICLINMPKRNRKGRMLLGEILGLKKYLEVVEKPRLLSEIKANPNFVSEILPFAYVLGVAQNIIECIQAYDEYKPNWYHGTFNNDSFNNFTGSMSQSITPKTSSFSSGGSGHSGGGHSGGGHGGGGGGSW